MCPIKVINNWWKDFFNDIYLITDARSVCDPELTSCEVDLLVRILRLKQTDRIIDICGGQGRHSIELARRGYKNLTVLDFSKYLLSIGKKNAEKEGLDIKFVCSDARYNGLKNGLYTVAFIMANSFGYFPSHRENMKILKEAYRLLCNRGRLLLDIANVEYVNKELHKKSWHEANDDILVCREKELKGGLIRAREVVISKSKGLLRDGYYCERLYTRAQIVRYLREAGFGKIAVRENVCLHKNKKDYGLLSSRMFVKASKT